MVGAGAWSLPSSKTNARSQDETRLGGFDSRCWTLPYPLFVTDIVGQIYLVVVIFLSWFSQRYLNMGFWLKDGVQQL